MRLLLAAVVSLLVPFAAQASDVQLSPSHVYIVPAKSAKSCYGQASEANRISFPLLTIRSNEKDPVTLMGAKLVIEHPQLLGGRHECSYDQTQIALLLNLKDGILKPGSQAVSACNLTCGGISFATPETQAFVAKGVIEILGVSTTAEGVQTPVRLEDEFAAEYFTY